MLDAHLSRGWISCSLSLLEPADPLTPPEADLTQIWGQVQEEEPGGKDWDRRQCRGWKHELCHVPLHREWPPCDRSAEGKGWLMECVLGGFVFSFEVGK